MASGERWLNGALLNALAIESSRGTLANSIRSVPFNTTYTDRKILAGRVAAHPVRAAAAWSVVFSPIVAALNEMRSFYETMDLAPRRSSWSKCSASRFSASLMTVEPSPTWSMPTATRKTRTLRPREEFYDFGSGPVVMNRTAGESVSLLQANSPGSNTIEFMRLCIQARDACTGPASEPTTIRAKPTASGSGPRGRCSNALVTVDDAQLSCGCISDTHAGVNGVGFCLRLGRSGEIILASTDVHRRSHVQIGLHAAFLLKPSEQLSAGLGRVAAGLKPRCRDCVTKPGRSVRRESPVNLRHDARPRNSVSACGSTRARLDVTLEDIMARATGTTPAGAA